MPRTSAPAARLLDRGLDVGHAEPDARGVGDELLAVASGFQKPKVTFGASTSPSEYSLSGRPSTSR